MSSGSGNVSSIVVLGGQGSGTASSPSAVNIPDSAQASAGSTLLYKTLISSSSSISSGNFMGFIDTTSASNSIYSVPAGKKFYISQFCYQMTNAVAQQTGLCLGTATATFTQLSATIPTGAVYWNGGVGGANSGLFQSMGNSVIQCINIPMVINAGLFPFVLNLAGGSGGFSAWYVGKEM